MSITIDQVVAAYVSTREEIKDLKKSIKELEDLQERREQWFNEHLTSLGMNSSRTDYGTVYKQRSERVSVADWDAVLEWITKSQAWEFLNHAVNKTAVLESMGKDRQYPPPPGVSYSATMETHVNVAGATKTPPKKEKN